ncbi:TPA: PilX N-terminal domain-containing pilus assembly protein [Stenotrophomonas maltophilia]|uniref:pilus assembly PilX family protein n=1 Tax=Stenotrophomonas maltophilia TaxID=40324 RepID=UPI0013129F69|nr:PilX N-terminal domain-containing pilus assembly protein [Stenotrophomonas maltophilia]MDV5765569.1 PilX N-terminal domain-containing pilus assembly protein [Stenotrophomonas maltophilia]UXL27729.1 PilX N-terminal domain-containing pilus assembly protein [Stenotrophomonas maltophilia]
MKTLPRSFRSVGASYQQRGAVLYVALIMLILLALLGIAGMQVAGLQERMAANYRAANRAFQNSEGVVRAAERAVEGIANRTGDGSGGLVQESSISTKCDDGFDPAAWAAERANDKAAAVNVRQIDACIIGESSLDMGKPLEKALPVYQITGFATDDADAASSAVVIDTVFKL